MESACTFNFGLSFLIKSTSSIKDSNLEVFTKITCTERSSDMFSNCRILVFSNTLKKRCRASLPT